MPQKVLRFLAIGTIAIACVAVLSAAALGRGRAHADLRILSGSVKRTGGTRAQPVYTGSFRVANVGNANAHALRVRVELTAAGRPARILSVFSTVSLKAGHRKTLRPKVKLPRGLAKVSWTVEACVVLGGSAKAKPAKDGCRKLAVYNLVPRAATVPKSTPAPPATTPVTTTTSTPTTPTTSGPVNTVPTQPITGYTANSPYWVADGLGQYEGRANDSGSSSSSYNGGYYTSGYYVVVPPSYDATNQTPETLVVWMHGCSGTARWDAQDLTGQFDSDRPFILISLSGPETAETNDGGPMCWDVSDQTDVNKVLTDVANVETHFNIDRRRVVIAGYSSGGDLAYQTIFTHANTFAGILAYNTNPVRDNIFGATYGLNAINNAIAAAAWKFPILQVSHDQDGIYHVARCGYSGYETCPDTDASGSTSPDAGVSPAINALQAAGFPVTFDVLSGFHVNPDTPYNCQNTTPSMCTGGNGYEIVHDLLDKVATNGWESPAS